MKTLIDVVARSRYKCRLKPGLPVICLLWVLASNGLALPVFAAEPTAQPVLEEVIVTARKREENIQDTPVAISVMNRADFEKLGLTDLSDLNTGYIPSLRIAPYAFDPSTAIIFMRGVGNTDAAQITKDAGVGIYLDGVSLGRVQGLGAELVDLERMEVLRGPQGTLFGRNTTGGAVNMISQKPTGELGVEVGLTAGNLDYQRGLVRVNFPALGALSSKISYLASERDGWVENSDPAAYDYYYEDKSGGRAALRLDLQDSLGLNIDYAYDKSQVDTTQLYYQLYRIEDNPLTGMPAMQSSPTVEIGPELDREDETRYDIAPLQPNSSDIEGHALTIDYDFTDALSLRSISAWRELDHETFANMDIGVAIAAAGPLLSGVLATTDTEQSQFSQEFQLHGTALNDSMDFVLGLYWFEEEIDESDNFGATTLFLPTYLRLPEPLLFENNVVDVETESWAIFGQTTWAPSWDPQLEISLGLRYSEDKKEGGRHQLQGLPDNSVLDVDSDSLDPLISLSRRWNDQLSTYIKWSTAYRAPGTSTRSSTFRAYDEERVKTFELGLKSDFWAKRARVNVAAFYSDYEDKQIDFSDPTNITVSETINASETIEIGGIEIDAVFIPLPGLSLGLQYTYLDVDVPLQFNPLTDAYERFVAPMSPQHAGSLTLDYTFAVTPIGTPLVNVTYIASDEYYFASKNVHRTDAYQLLDGRLSLVDIPLGSLHGSLSVSLWGRNLTDEEWITHSIYTQDVSVSQAFGTPRTYGLEVIYRYGEQR